MATRLIARYVSCGAASLSGAVTASGVGAASVAVGHPRKRTLMVGQKLQRTEGAPAQFAGAKTTFTHKVHIIHADEHAKIPCYRLLSPSGEVLNEEDDPKLDDETLLRWYRELVQLNVMDNILYDAQRQGRISFYMTAFGEEGTHIGTAAAIQDGDIIYAQYREQGVLMHLGYTLPQFMNQCFGNNLGHGKGRQMPVHYGSKELNFHTISSPLGTQLPQATGAAYGLKGTGRAVMCYFGDGSASEGDAHPAFNFAATLECPVVFICRNNGYAISTPVSQQYRGDGIASRAAGYGMDVIRVDGNDALGVYVATREARRHATTESRPVLIEAMTYRKSHHSTSDDATAYRSDDEVSDYAAPSESPIERFRNYIARKGIWNEDQQKALLESTRKEVLKHFVAAEKEKLPSVVSLFDDVYAEIPSHLKSQREEMLSHISKYPDMYPNGTRVPS